MAVTIGNFSPVDDGEIDAESPMTETLMKRNRDNSYWIDAGTRKTTETDTSKVLKPDGSGGVEWGSGGGAGTHASDVSTGMAAEVSISVPSSTKMVLGDASAESGLVLGNVMKTNYSLSISSLSFKYTSIFYDKNTDSTSISAGVGTLTLTTSYQAISNMGTFVFSVKYDSGILYIKLVGGSDAGDRASLLGSFI